MAKEVKNEMHGSGMWCDCSSVGHRRFGFGFFLGLLLVIFGAYEISKFYGWIPNVAFPWFPAVLLLVGLWMVLKRLM